jgi:hypothetical protein
MFLSVLLLTVHIIVKMPTALWIMSSSRRSNSRTKPLQLLAVRKGASSYPPFYTYSQHPSQIWWHQQLKDARDVSDLFRQRFHLQSEGHDYQSLPTGCGHDVFAGGMTFMAVGISLSMISRLPYIKYTFTVSPRAIHIGSKSVTLLATLGTPSRYVHNEQTRHNLKKIGTYIAPTEPNHNADMLCQHPMIINAIEEQRKRNKAYYNQERHPHFHGDINDYWWWSKTVQEQEIFRRISQCIETL